MLWLLFLLICIWQKLVPTWQIYAFAKVMNQSKKVKTAITLKPKSDRLLRLLFEFFSPHVQMAVNAVFHWNTVQKSSGIQN